MPKPLHRRIRLDLEAKIRAGEWPAGTRIPTEAELEERYGVSRTTVQRALYDLATSGMIRRHRRRGSFVTQAATETNLIKFVDLYFHEPVSPGPHETVDCRVILARDSELTHPDLDRSETLVRLERLKLDLADTPAAIELAVIPFRLVPDYVEHPWDTSSTSQALRKNGHAPARIRLYVEACRLDESEAELLRRTPGEPTLRCLRYTWLGDGTVAEVAQFVLAPGESTLYLERSLDENPETALV